VTAALTRVRSAAAVLLFVPVLAIARARESTSPEDARPHVVYVLTDDQRFDTLPGIAPYMPQDVFPRLQATLMAEGVTFTGAYNSNPLCAPTRASILSGGYYCHHTGVLRNSFPEGGARAFNDARSIGTLLQAKGYRTAFVGKYINGYSELTGRTSTGEKISNLKYVPPGWNVFIHRQFSYDWHENNFVVGSSDATGPSEGFALPRQRAPFRAALPDLVARGLPARLGAYIEAYDPDRAPYATTFVQEIAEVLIAEAKHGDEPWFVLLALEAPHQPAVPAREDRGRYADFVHRSPGLADDLTDKPLHVRRKAEHYRTTKPIGPVKDPNELWIRMLETLRGVDRLVGSIVDALDAEPSILDDTALFFSSDNGYLWGEHGLRRKRAPYEESLLAPLVARVPGVEPGTRSHPVAADLDVPVTILSLAGYPPDDLAKLAVDGRSLQPLLGSAEIEHRPFRFCQNYGTEVLGRNFDEPVWASVTEGSWKYVEYDYSTEDGSPCFELYDLETDPFELDGRHADPALDVLVERLAQLVERNRGLAVTGFRSPENALPTALLGQPYEHRIRAVGGHPPYGFHVSDAPFAKTDPTWQRGLPPGLTLAIDGTLTGVPRAAGTYELMLLLSDSQRAPHRGGRQTYRARVRLTVDGS